MKRGRLIKGIGGFYYVDVDGETYECKARGIFRQMKITPLVGDYVEISITDEQKKLGVMEKIMERSTELIRPTVANVNQAIIVFAVTQPEPNIMLLDRFLVLAESEELEVVICFNKVDLLAEEDYLPIVDRYRAIGYKVLLTSVKRDVGIADLKEVLIGNTSVFAGPSGVGKSTLLNKVHPELQLKTGEISVKTARGKHTTRHAELIAIEKNSWVVDTPGFSALSLDFMEAEDLALYFPEFNEYREECKFSSCQHIDEPKCGIKNALQKNLIAEERHNSYQQFLQEIKSNRRF
ncbi:ribosome biogenesis GTpase RsgA [Clostridium aceticum]|uniref:Small ribosomal subunit biogenesis GTPase RsgA n=1 Tax=Clostridium aceticum TaxID=84022 RepID=A0A0D8I7L5_9CLOT|nr:ribosome small subunit-dependent GTPase A [Clostridium aceticum]AKL95530.1 ribosome biogenesis GTpase RsgA [Clostridium aceticum]KJF26012.1 GTPase RsgA [Clostridium aceticum]